jgi:hypothetical protein
VKGSDESPSNESVDSYAVVPKTKKTTKKITAFIKKKHADECGIIYCLSKKECEAMARTLQVPPPSPTQDSSPSALSTYMLSCAGGEDQSQFLPRRPQSDKEGESPTVSACPPRALLEYPFACLA